MSAHRMSSGRPLAGLRVLDLSRILAGPYCAQMLGDFGAEVIKVERPELGDDARRMGAVVLKDPERPRSGEGAVYLSANRNKRSITIDLGHARGQELVRKLAAWADVLIENYKVGTLARYGLDYESLKAVNPRLVYCSITGYGQFGPKADWIGYDPVFQAQSGLMSITGHPDGVPGAAPMKIGINVSDMLAGYHALIGIQAALLERARSGLGQHLDIALLDCSIASLSNVAQVYLMSGKPPGREGYGGGSGGPAEILPCKGGGVFVACGTDAMFARFAALLGRPELTADERFATPIGRAKNKIALAQIILPLAGEWTREAMLEALRREGIPGGPVNDVAEAFADPQVKARGMEVPVTHALAEDFRVVGNPVRFSRTPAAVDRPPPRLGEHTDEILRDVLELSGEAIASLRADGAI